jgi:hypothetical protein
MEGTIDATVPSRNVSKTVGQCSKKDICGDAIQARLSMIIGVEATVPGISDLKSLG